MVLPKLPDIITTNASEPSPPDSSTGDRPATSTNVDSVSDSPPALQFADDPESQTGEPGSLHVFSRFSRAQGNSGATRSSNGGRSRASSPGQQSLLTVAGRPNLPNRNSLRAPSVRISRSSEMLGEKAQAAPQNDKGKGASSTNNNNNNDTSSRTQPGSVFRVSRPRAFTVANPLSPSTAPASLPSEGDRLSLQEETTKGKRARVKGAVSNAFNSIKWKKEGEDEEILSEEELKARQVAQQREQHDQQVVDLLDVLDPEVGVLTTMTDVQNSLFVPNLGRFVDRTRYLHLNRGSVTTKPSVESTPETLVAPVSPSSDAQLPTVAPPPKAATASNVKDEQQTQRSSTDSSTDVELKEMSELATAVRGKYLVLPGGLVDWDHWSEEDRAALDDYVRHLLHSKKWKARRAWRGFKNYVSTPLGAFVTIYASLLTFWGATWVLFIIGWLHAGDRQAYFVEICDQILTALFCVVGIGLAPFRAVDTYHMIYIAHYHRKSIRLYRELEVPPLPDENDLPAPNARSWTNAEEGRKRPPVLTVKEEATLLYHQTKFCKSHTFYRPHETLTHKAFPLDLLIVVVSLLDFHSVFQIALGSTTWSISYHHNFKKILTSIILSFSISCNITAGLVIAVGNRRTRKEEIVRAQLHRAVTEEAIKRKAAKAEREKLRLEKEAEKRSSVDEEHRGLVKHGSAGGRG